MVLVARSLSVCLVLLLSAVSFAQSVTFTSHLTGLNEKPNPGDPDGAGFSVVTIDPVANTVNYTILAQQIGTPSAAHIHRGLADAPGPVVVNFAPTFTNGFASGTVAASHEILMEILANPAAFYVNVHTAEFPGGAIRGQLESPSGHVVTLATALNGANEKPDPGDTDGSGFAIVRFDTDNTTIRYSLLVRDIAPPTAAHIHRGAPDVAGPVVVNFNPTFVNGTASGAVVAGQAIISEILNNPGGFYVNVHTADFPAGAVRGQLAPVAGGTTDVVFPIVGSVPGANNTFYRTDLSLLNTSGAATQVVLEYYGTGAAGMGSPTSTTTLSLASGEQLSLNGGTLQQLLGAADGTGALRVISTRPIDAVARIYNDQRAVDAGTLSQFVPGLSSEYNRTVGALPMLANETSANGYRTNIGWFNAGETTASVTFRLHRPDGSTVETAVREVPAGSQVQLPLSQLFPSITTMNALYVTFTSVGAPLYVYASVVDNKNGDAIFIPAQPR